MLVRPKIQFLIYRSMCARAARGVSKQGQLSIEPVSLAYNMYTNTDVDSGAPPLVIMHGLLGSKQNWNSISKALLNKLLPRRKIIVVDARNHGESPHSAHHSYPHLVQDLVELFKELNVERAAVLGHSMGGRAMMYLALKYPQLVDRAIIVDISPVSSPANLHSMESIFQAIKSVQLPAALSLSEARKKGTHDLMKTIKDKPTVDFIMLNLKKLNNGSFVWKANIDSLQRNFGHIAHFPQEIAKLNQFRGPVLFIGGSKSSYIQQSDMHEIGSFFPNASLRWLDTGHLVQLEKPAEFIGLVQEFLN